MAIFIFLVMAILIAILHVSVIEGSKDKKWWVKHILLAPFIWPLCLVDVAMDKPFWYGLLALAVWLEGCWFTSYLLAPPVLMLQVVFFFFGFLTTLFWWCIATLVMGFIQELSNPYPLADYF